VIVISCDYFNRIKHCLGGAEEATIYFTRDRGPEDRELSFGVFEYYFTSTSVEIFVNCDVNVDLVGLGKKVPGLHEMQCGA
jgi:hypothetical protein